jgi:MFS transporter, DHA3 family, macrolide efflux protein
MERAAKPQNGMIPFTMVIIANLISQTGTQMTRFAVVTWAWQITGSATAAGLITICAFGATVVTSAFAGALVDRWSRKRTIVATEALSMVVAGALVLLYMTDSLQVWHLGVLGALGGVIESLQFPAYMSAVTTMVPPSQYARANGMFQFVWQGSMMVGPILAASMIAALGMQSVYLADAISFFAVIAAVALVHIPQPAAPEDGQHSSIWAEIMSGFRYIWERQSLLGMLLVVLVANIACGTFEGVFRPMVLARTNDSVGILGQALLWVGVGGVLGGILMSVWGGPKSKTKVQMILGSMGAMFIFGLFLMALGQNILVWGVAGFAYGFFVTIINTLIFALWQQKVEPGIQGRVFNILRLVGLASTPVAVAAATMLSDQLFEPAMLTGGSLATLFGGLVGTGKGAGMALVLTFSGVFGVIATVGGYLWKAVRQAETLLPDHSQEVA